MQRMIFEGFKRVMPDCHLTWAVPRQYLEAADPHPFVDEVIEAREVNREDYPVIYNITFACGRYEIRMSPNADKHRSDIWAEHCGVVLSSHNMQLNLSDAEKAMGKEIISKYKSSPNAPVMVMCPISAQAGKDLSVPVMKDVVLKTWDRGCNVVALHNKIIPELHKMNVPLITNVNIRTWMSVLNAADYVLSVDTASFHCAGGLGKPLTGVFTYCDGKVYGKYYDFVLVQKHRDNGDWPCGPCFNWGMCSVQKTGQIKPCAKEITSELVIEGVDKMFARWPYKER